MTAAHPRKEIIMTETAPDAIPVTRDELAAAALAADRARETIAMLGEDLIRQRKRAERAEAALRDAESNAAGTIDRDGIPWYALGLEGADPATEIADLRSRIHHTGAALAGDNEGVRLWMLDCGNLVQKHRERAERAEAELAQAVAAERERIRGLFDQWITIAMSEPNAHPPETWKAAFADLISDEPQFATAGGKPEPSGENGDTAETSDAYKQRLEGLFAPIHAEAGRLRAQLAEHRDKNWRPE